MKEQKIVIDVGGHGFPLDAGSFYKQGDIAYVFEPRLESFNEIVKRCKPHKDVKVYNLALSNYVGTSTFYETKKKNCSSLLKPNEQVLRKLNRNDIINYKTYEVEVNTLDNIFPDLERVDYLKIDTQGNEYEVLEGGINLLKKTRTIKVEVEFIEWYKNQKLDTQVVEFLNNQGFEKVRESLHTNHGDYIFNNTNL